MTYKPGPCPIWGEPFFADIMPGADQLLRVRSPRAGGVYSVSYRTQVTHLAQLNTEEKARLTTWLIDERSRGVEWPTVTSGTVEYVRSKPSLPVRERADRLLQYLVELSENVGERVCLHSSSTSANFVRERLSHSDIRPDARSTLERSDTAAARSESTTVEEVESLLEFLAQRRWISLNLARKHAVTSSGSTTYVTPVTVLVDGYSLVEETATNLDSSQAFVAMWFNDSMDHIYEGGFEPAIKDAGYKPLRIDQKPHFGKIDDQVIAEIRRSRFVVADFTHGEKGARGSVYFEAGFAFGLDIPVIFTCRKDLLDDLHFDTRQYPHIAWEEGKMDEFQTELQNRIVALIGEGPDLPA